MWLSVRGQWWAREHGNEPSGSIKSEKYLDQLSDYYILKKDGTPWS
jgi:hypothetical protein